MQQVIIHIYVYVCIMHVKCFLNELFASFTEITRGRRTCPDRRLRARRKYGTYCYPTRAHLSIQTEPLLEAGHPTTDMEHGSIASHGDG
jgi:hypothetical protein